VLHQFLLDACIKGHAFAHTCIHLYRPIIMASFTLYTSLQTWAQSVIRMALVDLDVVSRKGGLLSVGERPGKGVVACGVCES
jgi:hypothetical protein